MILQGESSGKNDSGNEGINSKSIAHDSPEQSENQDSNGDFEDCNSDAAENQNIPQSVCEMLFKQSKTHFCVIVVSIRKMSLPAAKWKSI